METWGEQGWATTSVLPDLIKEEVLRLTDPYRPDVFMPVSLEYAKARLEELGVRVFIAPRFLEASWVGQRTATIQEHTCKIRTHLEHNNLVPALAWLGLLERVVAHRESYKLALSNNAFPSRA